MDQAKTCSPMRVWVSSIFYKLKMDDNQTWTIFLRKRMDRAYGQTRKTKPGSTLVLHAVTTTCRYKLSGSWEKHGMHKGEERAEQRWQPRRRARAPSSMVHACFPSLAATPLPSYDFWTMSCLEISVSKLMFLTLYYQHARFLCLYEYSHFGAMFSTLHFRALASCWKWRRNCGFVAWSWLGASHCCSHVIRLCTHAENMLGSYVLFLVQDFWEGFRV
jgi:hypothetical protein